MIPISCGWRRVLLYAIISLLVPASRAAELEVDCAQTTGRIRALHGGNGGPLGGGGLIDLTAGQRELRIPYVRLHDCHWPNPDVVDVHAVFPSFNADAVRPESYDFSRTDEYIQGVIDTGAQVVYRLGESIEHTRRKYHVHPPADPEKWAAVCLGVIRHYNEGWAGGFHHGIRYWEIWNEPENRPAMWTGSDEDFFRLYESASKAIKARFPELKVGGPSLGDTGRIVDGRLEPSAFALAFLERCRDRHLPLDFFSWHLYTNDPSECLLRSKAIREVLDRHGFGRSELHFNEWNYLPGNGWSAMMLEGQGLARERWYGQMGGPAGAAFAACVLINLQDSPVDVANYYSVDSQDFGLFSRHGVPRRTFYAFKAFSQLLETPVRLRTTGGDPGRLAVCAGANEARSEVRILVGSLAEGEGSIELSVRNLPWPGASRCTVLAVDGGHELAAVQGQDLPGGGGSVQLKVNGPSVLMVRVVKGG